MKKSVLIAFLVTFAIVCNGNEKTTSGECPTRARTLARLKQANDFIKNHPSNAPAILEARRLEREAGRKKREAEWAAMTDEEKEARRAYLASRRPRRPVLLSETPDKK